MTLICNLEKCSRSKMMAVEENGTSCKNKLRRQEHLPGPNANLIFVYQELLFLRPKIMNIK